MRVCKFVFAALVGTVAACGPYEPGPVATELTAESAGRIFFETVDAYDFVDYAGTPTVRTMHGDLSLPPGDGPVRGAAILSHGSGGTGSRQTRMGEYLVERGYAVFELDHFTPRDIGSTVRDQLRVTAQGMLGDVFAAQRLLASHPRIDGDKIGLIGWSKGGIVATIGAVDRFSEFAGRAAPLAFSIAFYPFCGFDLTEETLSSPLLILVGDEDNWTTASPCQREVGALQARGQPAEIVVYPGARHGFDSRSPDFEISQAITVRDESEACTLKVDAVGRTLTVDGARGVDTLERRLEYLDRCGVRGVTFGGQAAAREAAFARSEAFLGELLPR